MTRGPVLKLPSAMKAAEVKEWLDVEENFKSKMLNDDKILENTTLADEFSRNLEKVQNRALKLFDLF